jgi:DNA-binding NtrC family response regulator
MMTDHDLIRPEDSISKERPVEEMNHDQKKKVLVLDDEKGVRIAVQMMLKKDYTVFLAENGKQTMDILKNEAIDLVITDIKLENENGLDVMEEVLKQYNNMRFIVITAAPDDKTIQRAHRMGAKYSMDKPFLVDEFLEVVADAIGD